MRHDFPKELITGIEKIDFQHMELFARIWQLHDSYLEGKSEQKVTETIEYLKCYVDEHFATEEKYMQEYEYPDIEMHTNLHRDFSFEFILLEKKFREKGFDADFNLDLNLKIVEWLKKHVMTEDKKLAAFLKGIKNAENLSFTN